MSQPSATIIGAGIVGVSAAAFLQREGYKVTIVDRVPPGEGASFGNAGGLAFAEIVPTVHPHMLMKIPGWLLDPLGPLTIRWSYLPKALPWFLSLARNSMPDRVKAITAARADLAMRVVSDFVHNGQARDVQSVMVDGKWLMKDGAVLTMDEEKILRDAQRIANEAWSRTFKTRFKPPAGFSPDALP